MKCNYPRFLRRYVKSLQSTCSEWRSERAVMLLKYSLIGSFIFCMAAHAFAYFNFAPLHDSLNYVSRLAGTWEVSLGRFLQPIYGQIRGEFTMPWMSGMLTILYIGLASFLINDLFEIENGLIAAMTSGFLAANATMTNVTMVFTYVMDVFALALLLACIGAYAIIRLQNLLGVFMGSICFAVSMGLYQSYVLVGGLLLVVYTLLQAVCDWQLLRHQWVNWLRYIAAVLLTALIYYAMYKRFLSYYGTEMASANSYNSPARLGLLDVKSMILQVKNAYNDFMEYFFGIGCGKLSLIQIGTIGLFALSGILFVVYAVKKRMPLFNVLLIILGVLLFPGMGQVVSILAQKSMYFLTVHALYLMYPAVLAVLSRIQLSVRSGEAVQLMKRSVVLRGCVLILCGCVLFGNIRFSNEMYAFRSVQYDKTISFVTRLMERIDSVPGYVRNNTEVVFIGDLSGGLVNIGEPEGWRWMEGMSNTGITYLQVLRSCFSMLGEWINISMDYSDMSDYIMMEEVQAMPAFPDQGCCRMIDGRLLVKLLNF